MTIRDDIFRKIGYERTGCHKTAITGRIAVLYYDKQVGNTLHRIYVEEIGRCSKSMFNDYERIDSSLNKEELLACAEYIKEMERTNMNIMKKNKNAIIPTYGTKDSAGMDLHTIETVDIAPGETAMIHTGIAMEIPTYYFGAVYPRSGIASKRGLRLANCVGVIDSDYRGEIMVPLYNDSAVVQRIHTGERIAQLVLQPCVHVDLKEVDTLSETERGEGGFGHTGTN